jgi:uncharacterized protein (DUF2267 family)
MNDIIRGRCDGLEADPVWESPLPDGHADTVAAILEAVREDWRDAPAPASGYRIALEYTPATGVLNVDMGPADPNEAPPADLIAPLPIRHAVLRDYWPEGPFDPKAYASALADDAAERIAAAMGIDRNDPATAALIEEVENDGLDYHAARAESDRRVQAVIDSMPESMPLDALPAGAEMAEILRRNGIDPDRYRIVYGPRASVDLSGVEYDPATNPYTELFREERFTVIEPEGREEPGQ